MKYLPSRQQLLHHPLIIIPPLVVILGLAWQQYISAGRNLNLPTHELNLLSTVPQPSAQDPLSGWKLSQNGEATYSSYRSDGIVSNNAIKLSVTSYKNGSVTMTGPKVSLTPSQTYLFKGYYTSSMQFGLLAHYYYADGTDKIIHLDTYSGRGTEWSTASHAFKADKITAVQFIYKLASIGTLTIDGMYLEPKQNVFIPKQIENANNAIPNSKFASTSIDMPDDWTTYQSGDNIAAFSSHQDAKGAYLKTTIKDYKNGESKWQYTPQSVIANQRYQFSAAYHSDTPAKITAEYVLKDGKHQFETIADLLPAGEWTNITYPVEVPSDATSLVISIVLKSNGSIATREYTLVNITKPGAVKWKRPLVSITFDDGWRSAYSNALPILDRYGYKGTFYINPSSIETPNFMSADDLTKLSEAHHEIAAHGYSHSDMTILNPDALDNQLGQGKAYLANAGFSTTHFSTPYGKSDAEVQWYARNYFSTMRGVDPGVNTRQNFDAYNLNALFLKNDTSQQTIASALEKAKATDGWLILVYHGVGPTQTRNTLLRAENAAISIQAFSDQISLIQKSGAAVLPVDAAYKEVVDQ